MSWYLIFIYRGEKAVIRDALVFTKKTLDEHLRNHFQLQESITVLNHLVDQSGEAPLKNQNKMVISLINLEQETNRAFSNRNVPYGENGFESINPSVRFNMDLLFTACFEDYEEALKFLTATISYFQAYNSLNQTNHPDIPPGLRKLNFEIESLDYSETHNLWTAMGAKYRPSVIYKMRLITIQSLVATGSGSLTKNATTSVQP